ncbi:MAG: hypothetical protein ABIL06_13245 [Pseudomonadota bacterium]|uniref:Uncharacterized protein n=1 Tax=viral metagenome TaxID=1070528 RepID=A0A6H1ZHH1_9ZZZZ
MSKFDKFHELQRVNAYTKQSEQMWKCTKCGSEHFHDDGWSGSPDEKKCHSDCRMDDGDWLSAKKSTVFRKNFDSIFPHSPGAGL